MVTQIAEDKLFCFITLIKIFDSLNCQIDKEKIAAKKELIPTKNSRFLTLYEMVRLFFFLSFSFDDDGFLVLAQIRFLLKH